MPTMDELKTAVETYLHQVLEILEEEAAFEVEIEGDDGIYVNLSGSLFSLPEERPILSALEHLLRGAIRRKTGKEVEIIVDANGAVKRRRAELIRFALSKAEEVVRDRKKIRLNPMPSHERRTIHVTLADFPGVSTASVGSGDHRRVVIEPVET
jgi:spoIIIJ-associated protein